MGNQLTKVIDAVAAGLDTISLIMAHTGVSRQTCSGYLRRLCQAKAITVTERFQRPRSEHGRSKGAGGRLMCRYAMRKGVCYERDGRASREGD